MYLVGRRPSVLSPAAKRERENANFMTAEDVCRSDTQLEENVFSRVMTLFLIASYTPNRYINGSCTEGSSCKFAHGNAELHEWEERRKALQMKFKKARKDHLIAPNDNDFGKYSFLFKDLK
jgi:hypothetical protein